MVATKRSTMASARGACNDFWRSAVHGIVDSFEAGEVDQLKQFLTSLCALVELSQEQALRITGMISVSRDDLDALVGGLRRHDGQVWSDCQNTLRARVLFRASDQDVQNIGDDYLRLDGDVEEKGLFALNLGVVGEGAGATRRAGLSG